MTNSTSYTECMHSISYSGGTLSPTRAALYLLLGQRSTTTFSHGISYRAPLSLAHSLITAIICYTKSSSLVGGPNPMRFAFTYPRSYPAGQPLCKLSNHGRSRPRRTLSFWSSCVHGFRKIVFPDSLQTLFSRESSIKSVFSFVKGELS